jgi:hypothetical protein
LGSLDILDFRIALFIQYVIQEVIKQTKIKEERTLNPASELILQLARESGDLHGRVWRYAVAKLAEQLFSCVECKHRPRADTDWLTAEEFLKQHSDLTSDSLVVNYILAKVCKQQLQPLHKAAFDEKTIRAALADDSLMDECLGRLIWNHGYQQIKRHLPRTSYGRILFH